MTPHCSSTPPSSINNGDRGVNIAECTRGLKALGLPVGVAEAAALAIVARLSIQTRGWLLAMNIDVRVEGLLGTLHAVARG